MKEIPEDAYPVERLTPEELQIARGQNVAELNRRSTTRILTIQQTRQYPNVIEISYGIFSQVLPLEVKDKVKPGTKIVVVHQSEEILSPIEGVYVLGENLKEKLPSS